MPVIALRPRCARCEANQAARPSPRGRSSWGGVNLDTGNFRTKNPYADLERLAPYAIVVQMKTEITRAGMKPEEADFKRKFQMLRAVNYRGYVVLEYEAAEDAKTAVPRYARIMRDLCG
jgi:hypothetical protein